MSTETQLNRFQRWYFAWAEPYYQRMEPQMQAQARAMDRFLYSRRGLGVWLGLAGAWLGSSAGLIVAGMPWAMALALPLLILGALLVLVLGAWLMPEKYRLRSGSHLPGVLLSVLIGIVSGWVLMRLILKGSGVFYDLPYELEGLLRIGVPAGLGGMLLIAALTGVTAAARRYQLQQELQEARVAEERERMAREASEARLRLLQAQIQPHFIFNTLSAVQHWVDSGDARASELLRALTAFLRGSAELMLKPQVSLAEELALVGHYLSVMRARWGERLRYQLEIDAATAERAQLPPGIVLSLVENALEHGLAPTLAGGSLQISLQAQREGWRLRIVDDGVGLAEGWQEGLGVGNSRARLEAAFGPRARLLLCNRDSGGTEVCLEVQREGGAT